MTHVVKVLCFYHPDDPEALRHEQEATVTRLFHAARRNRLEFLLEVIPSKAGPVDDMTTAEVIRRFYEIGVFPDWWKLEPMQSAAGWEAACKAIVDHDPYTRGIVVLGLGATTEDLAESFAKAARFPLVKGFAVGRTIFGEAAEAFFTDRLTEAEAVTMMAENYARLCAIWDRARAEREA